MAVNRAVAEFPATVAERLAALPCRDELSVHARGVERSREEPILDRVATPKEAHGFAALPPRAHIKTAADFAPQIPEIPR